ncbi:uncharacterized protein LOC111934816 [Cyanistes caeruleus]|uniref:uncharacterized protein LOC111934816 n=1 Tax=Cyanistes caeruleus TaxID=156563 RepID=UPI000CDB1C6A|nr:uncharacterized protein LOC111934816 [Cyanistes caeruleus]
MDALVLEFWQGLLDRRHINISECAFQRLYSYGKREGFFPMVEKAFSKQAWDSLGDSLIPARCSVDLADLLVTWRLCDRALGSYGSSSVDSVGDFSELGKVDGMTSSSGSGADFSLPTMPLRWGKAVSPTGSNGRQGATGAWPRAAPGRRLGDDSVSPLRGRCAEAGGGSPGGRRAENRLRRDSGFGSTGLPQVHWTAVLTDKDRLESVCTLSIPGDTPLDVDLRSVDITIVRLADWFPEWPLELVQTSVAGLAGAAQCYVSRRPMFIVNPEGDMAMVWLYITNGS